VSARTECRHRTSTVLEYMISFLLTLNCQLAFLFLDHDSSSRPSVRYIYDLLEVRGEEESGMVPTRIPAEKATRDEVWLEQGEVEKMGDV
jgi:hypothetical protein